jgi:hypothetical protein
VDKSDLLSDRRNLLVDKSVLLSDRKNLLVDKSVLHSEGNLSGFFCFAPLNGIVKNQTTFFIFNE